MKKYIYLIALFLVTLVNYSQTGITYQAVILKPNGVELPGVNNTAAPLINTAICLEFTILDSNAQTEYIETITTVTDAFGMVNTLIGSGTQTGGYATSFANIDWNNAEQKALKVALDDKGLCTNFLEISTQNFSSVPFAFSATNAANVTGIVPIEHGGTNATTVIGAKTNLGLENVDNTSDLNKPISIATQNALNLKENSANKSTDGTLPDVTNTKFPTELAVKTYVDASSAVNAAALAAEVVRATTAENTLTTNLAAEVTRAITAEATKEDAVNKSTDGTLATNSDIKFPTEQAVKTYVNASSAANAAALAAEVLNLTNADTTLQSNINNLSTTVTANANTAANADANLQSNINNLTATVTANANTAANADTTLQSNINNLSTTVTANANTAANADANLQSNINNLTATVTANANTAANADATLQSNINNLSTTVTANADTAANADTTLQSNINNLSATVNANATTAANADATLQSNINALSSTVTANAATAANADTTLQSNINNLSATVTANANTAANATALKENSANKSTDVTLADVTNIKFPTELAVKTYVDGSSAANAAALAAEIINLTNADTALQSNINNLTATVTANANTAANADTTLQSNINNLTATVTANAANAWSLIGNANTVDGTNFIGTTDEIPFTMRVNNEKAGRIGVSTEGNTFYGYQSGNSNSGDNFNTGIGQQALYSNTTGFNNTASGLQALYSNTTGFNNTASGLQALYSNTEGNSNTANGLQALYSNTTGLYNTASGLQALYSNTEGNSNTANGLGVLYKNVTGNKNTASGLGALFENTTGNNNTATGVNALTDNSTGNDNTAGGLQALRFNTTGNDNTANGKDALFTNRTGNENTAFGSNAGSLITGSNNTAIGSRADVANGGLNNATAIGAGAVVDDSNKIQLGNSAVTAVNTSGTYTGAGFKTPNGTANDYLMANGTTSAGPDLSTIQTNFVTTTADPTNISNVNVGNVGIGTTTPTEKLDVAGNAKVSGKLSANGGNASGNFSVAMGLNTIASAFASTAMGDSTYASGSSSTAMGYVTIASGFASTAMGDQTEATGDFSTAMGLRTTATANYSTAMGNSTTASNDYATAMGNGTTASGFASTAIGYITTASGTSSTAMGSSTNANSFAETAIGTNNTDYTPNSTYSYDAADRLFVIGNGVDENNKSDAMVVLKNGNTTINGTTTATSFVKAGGLATDYLMANGTTSAGPDLSTIQTNFVTTTADPTNISNVNAGNVGIGTYAPTEKLDVAGNIKLSGTINGLTIGANNSGNNMAIGIMALNAGLSANSIAIGPYSMINTHGISNTAVGLAALAGDPNGSLSSQNTALGTGAIERLGNSLGRNTGIGYGSLGYTTTGDSNTGIGAGSMNNNTTGNYNTGLGTMANVASGDLTNATAVGFAAVVDESNKIQLGNIYVTAVNTSGTYTGAGFKTSNGTANEYLMADGTTSTGPDLSTIQTNFVTTTANSDNITNVNTGNVGIGTDTPTEKLDVAGNAKISGKLSANGGNANGDNSTALGANTSASGILSTAMGEGTSASGNRSTAMGYATSASGFGSTAMGQITNASGDVSTAMGDQTRAFGFASTAMGSYTNASGEYSTAMGLRTTATANYSTAMGKETTASGDLSTAMGDGTIASGGASTAMGNRTSANGELSTAIGDRTTASGFATTAMGARTTASGDYSTAMGVFTNASGSGSTAMGSRTTAIGSVSTALGNQTNAQSFGETAIGNNNTDYTPNSTNSFNATDRLFVIGNGVDENNKSDAMVVLKNGNTTINGEVTVTKIKIPNGQANEYLMADGTTSSATASDNEADEEFVAAGAETSFILPNTPRANSKVKMYINGIRISKTAYTVVGANLTYNPAFNGNYTITANDRIQFEYFY